MLEVNNNFLLVGLIIVAVTCIYLLYLNLSKASELTSLKSALTSLIQQNKKRDEINNFLLERVDTLTAVINGQVNLVAAPIPADVSSHTQVPVYPVPETHQPREDVEDFDSAEIDEILSEEQVNYQTTQQSEPLSNEDPVSQASDVESQIHNVEESLPVVESDNHNSVKEHVLEQEVDRSAPVAKSLSELINTSEFGDDVNFLFMAKNATTKHNEQVGEPENDLIEGLLETEQQSVNGDLASELGDLDPTIDYTAVPKDKKKLTSGYTAKQLKSIARHFGVKSRGTKTELVNRIYDKLV